MSLQVWHIPKLLSIVQYILSLTWLVILYISWNKAKDDLKGPFRCDKIKEVQQLENFPFITSADSLKFELWGG